MSSQNLIYLLENSAYECDCFRGIFTSLELAKAACEVNLWILYMPDEWHGQSDGMRDFPHRNYWRIRTLSLDMYFEGGEVPGYFDLLTRLLTRDKTGAYIINSPEIQRQLLAGEIQYLPSKT